MGPVYIRAARTIIQLFIPVVRRVVSARTRRAARRFLRAVGLQTNKRPNPGILRGAGSMFQDWPEAKLRAFCRKLFPVAFARGEYICHCGDPSLILYILVKGQVDVMVRAPNSKSKASGKGHGMETLATLQPATCFGEYGVFAEEPRSASLLCKERVFTWACSKEVTTLHPFPYPCRDWMLTEQP